MQTGQLSQLAHPVLGLGLGIAPVGRTSPLTGHFARPPCILALPAMTWCGGFDIIYALQDADFDRKNGLYSIPARFSARVSLLFSILLHVVSVAGASPVRVVLSPEPAGSGDNTTRTRRAPATLTTCNRILNRSDTRAQKRAGME